jgi:uncharacterized protein (DUF1684 family)
MERGAILALGLWLSAGAGEAATTTPGDGAYATEIEAARSQRVARLTAPDGWLTLIGLHFLQMGDNTVGSAKDNTVVLAKGPAHLGKVTLAVDGRIDVALAPDADARVNGRTVLSAELFYGEGKPTVVSFGTVNFFVIERGGKMALRVKDSEAERRTHFLGLDFFPTDPAWRIEARWVPFEQPREISIANVLGQVSPAIVSGKAVFERGGTAFELLPIEDGDGGPLFFVISDLTSGKETYAAARFLYADPPVDGKLVLDFNAAQNPPCAFTPFATCPLPPKENRLPFAVTAGEKNYRGGHD